MTRHAVKLLLVFALVAFVSVVPSVWSSREMARDSTPVDYVLPSKYSKILACGHRGLLSDFLFLKTATFIGGRGVNKQSMTKEDWHFVTHSLDVITDLDPWFLDPYVLAEGVLAWDARQPEVANALLKKGVEHRTKDWRLAFYVGFNNFHFLSNYAEASEYIMRAAALPGSPGYLKTLGGRLAYYGGKSQTAVLFLKEMLADADSLVMRARLGKRLAALEAASVIEAALERFKAEHQKAPHDLSALVDLGYLKSLPLDPYGGQWVVLENGRIFSTSKFVSTE